MESRSWTLRRCSTKPSGGTICLSVYLCIYLSPRAKPRGLCCAVLCCGFQMPADSILMTVQAQEGPAQPQRWVQKEQTCLLDSSLMEGRSGRWGMPGGPVEIRIHTWPKRVLARDLAPPPPSTSRERQDPSSKFPRPHRSAQEHLPCWTASPPRAGRACRPLHREASSMGDWMAPLAGDMG